MLTGREGEVARYPSPEELWQLTFAEASAWRDRFADVPYEDKGGSHPPRYYQDIAIALVLEALAAGRTRAPPDPRHGHRQDLHRVSDRVEALPQPVESERPADPPPAHPLPRRPQPPRQPGLQRLLRLPEDALVRIEPADIRKKGKVPKNGSIFFTIFQTFMSGPLKDGQPTPYFGEYPPDFFDYHHHRRVPPRRRERREHLARDPGVL
jgi:type I restriction enzyme R subunit